MSIFLRIPTISIKLNAHLLSRNIAGTCINASSIDYDFKNIFKLNKKNTSPVLITDPPYCLLTRRRNGGDLRDRKDTKNKLTGRFETIADYKDFTQNWLSNIISIIGVNTSLIIWTNYLGRDPILEIASNLGYGHFCGEYVWAKRTGNLPIQSKYINKKFISHINANDVELHCVEFALIIRSKPLPKLLSTDPARVWSIVSGYDDDGEGKLYNHPNHKPFSIIEPLIRQFSNPGDLIIDPFSGSGSVGVAALRLHRDILSVEIDNYWAEKSNERFKIELNKYKL